MKKIILIITLFLLYGCGKKDDIKKELSISEMNDILFEYGDKLYENEEYKNFDLVDGQYYISLSNLKIKYNYNFDNFINEKTHKVCNKETSGIYFDVNNIRKLEYYKNPIVIDLKCEWSHFFGI